MNGDPSRGVCPNDRSLGWPKDDNWGAFLRPNGTMLMFSPSDVYPLEVGQRDARGESTGPQHQIADERHARLTPSRVVL
jgi:hypothetical protein